MYNKIIKRFIKKLYKKVIKNKIEKNDTPKLFPKICKHFRKKFIKNLIKSSKKSRKIEPPKTLSKLIIGFEVVGRKVEFYLCIEHEIEQPLRYYIDKSVFKY